MAEIETMVGSRRTILGAALLGAVGAVASAGAKTTPAPPAEDEPSLAHVMDIVVLCSAPEPPFPGPGKEGSASKDGQRDVIWPIVGGRFEGPGLRGSVVPGGGDFPVIRPDGVMVIDALYRLRTDDGTTIIIHNKGLAYPLAYGRPRRYRLMPDFTVPAGRHDWLNKAMFVATLIVPVPADKALPLAPGENQRLIRVYRVD
jgi:hypothetical protein